MSDSPLVQGKIFSKLSDVIGRNLQCAYLTYSHLQAQTKVCPALALTYTNLSTGLSLTTRYKQSPHTPSHLAVERWARLVENQGKALFQPVARLLAAVSVLVPTWMQISSSSLARTRHPLRFRTRLLPVSPTFQLRYACTLSSTQCALLAAAWTATALQACAAAAYCS